jgi:hypothetical protein
MSTLREAVEALAKSLYASNSGLLMNIAADLRAILAAHPDDTEALRRLLETWDRAWTEEVLNNREMQPELWPMMRRAGILGKAALAAVDIGKEKIL